MLTCSLKITHLLHSLQRSLFSVRCLLVTLVAVISVFMVSSPAQAAVDKYVRRFLAKEPISLDVDAQGQTKQFSPEDLSAGKELFESNCINCHVGGATLPDPQVSLSLEKLQAASPRRDLLDNLVAFMRQPMTYDGTQETYWCRQLSPTSVSQQQVESLAAFVLTAAQKAPGWGTDSF